MTVCNKVREIQSLLVAASTSVGDRCEQLYLKYESIVQDNRACFSPDIYAKFYYFLSDGPASGLADFARFQAYFGGSQPRREFLRLFRSKFQNGEILAKRMDERRPAEYVKEFEVSALQLEDNLEKYFLSFLMKGFMTSSLSSEFFFNFMENEFVLEMWRRDPQKLLNILAKVMAVIGDKIDPSDEQRNVLISSYNLLKLYAAAYSRGKSLDVKEVKAYLDSTRVPTRGGIFHPPGVVRGPEVLIWLATSLSRELSISKKTLDYFNEFPGFREQYLQPLYDAYAQGNKKQLSHDNKFQYFPETPSIDPMLFRGKASEIKYNRNPSPYWIVSRVHNPSQYEKEYKEQSQTMNASLERYAFLALASGYTTSLNGRFLAEFVSDGNIVGAWNKQPVIVLNALRRALAVAGSNIDFYDDTLLDRNAMVVLYQLLERHQKTKPENGTSTSTDVDAYLRSLRARNMANNGVLLGAQLFRYFVNRVRAN